MVEGIGYRADRARPDLVVVSAAGRRVAEVWSCQGAPWRWRRHPGEVAQVWLGPTGERTWGEIDTIDRAGRVPASLIGPGLAATDDENDHADPFLSRRSSFSTTAVRINAATAFPSRAAAASIR